MPAPLGNQYAVGNQGGRPPKYDLVKEAQELLEWSKNPTSLCLYQFTFDKPYLAVQLTEFAQQNEEFSLALRKAKERLVVHREAACNQGKMNSRIWGRSVRIYDHMLRAEEEETKDRDAERKRGIYATISPQKDTLKEFFESISNKSADLVGRTIPEEYR